MGSTPSGTESVSCSLTDAGEMVMAMLSLGMPKMSASSVSHKSAISSVTSSMLASRGTLARTWVCIAVPGTSGGGSRGGDGGSGGGDQGGRRTSHRVSEKGFKSEAPVASPHWTSHLVSIACATGQSNLFDLNSETPPSVQEVVGTFANSVGTLPDKRFQNSSSLPVRPFKLPI